MLTLLLVSLAISPQGGALQPSPVKPAEEQVSIPLVTPPPDPFERLSAALVRYQAIQRAGGWPLLSFGPVMRVGDVSTRVTILRQRLTLEDDLSPSDLNDPAFDLSVRKALMHAQKRFGLTANGVLDTATVDALNVPISTRIDQIKVNLERVKILPNEQSPEHIVVNTADFRLNVIDRGKLLMTRRVVVGKPYRSTPVFRSKITSIVLNPTWRVPRKVAVDVILPAVHKNPSYLRTNKFSVFEGSEEEPIPVDPASVDWKKINASNLPYRFIQQPGRSNALGKIKFLFPNSYGVYLHDTPARELFNKSVRTFSAGCIRSENPLGLAILVLKDQAPWKATEIRKKIKSGKTIEIGLRKPIPIDVVYLTAWVEPDGSVQFREDVYGRDTFMIDDAAEQGGDSHVEIQPD